MSITIEEIRNAKREAENAIHDILDALAERLNKEEVKVGRTTVEQTVYMNHSPSGAAIDSQRFSVHINIDLEV